MNIRSLLLPIIAVSSVVWSQEDDPHQATDLEVTAKPLASVQRVGQDISVASSLQFIPGVTVLTQGQPVGQTDISIRGSGFSGAGLSIAGLSLRNPQTEHFHAELPIPGWWLGQPEVLTGVSQAVQSEGHLTGTVSFMPLPLLPASRVTSGLDNKSGYWVNADSQLMVTDQVGVGVFAGHTEIPSVDFDDNDIQASRVGARAQYLTEEGQADLLFGHQDKTFGARGYYGVNDALKAEETTQDTLLLGSWQSISQPGTSFSFLLREFDDDYQLWLPTSLFRNQHTSRTAATQASYTVPVSESVRIPTRIAADLEDIDSTNLGDFDRSRLAVTAVPEIQITDQILLMAGVRGELLESDEDYLLPLARVEVTPTESLLWFAEVSESVRRPSYTELNYESPGSLGNAGLGVQEQIAWETGVAWYLSAQTTLDAALFHQSTRDTIDWVRPDPTATRWQAENIGDVDTLGIETILSHRVTTQLNANLRYQWLDKDADTPPYSSRYFLDYAKHLVTATLDWSCTEWMRIELSQLWRDQVDNPLRTEGGNEQFLTEIAIHMRAEALPHVQWSLMVHNALDDDYRVFPGQDTVTGRRVSASVTIDW